MFYENFPPFGIASVKLEFECKKCNRVVKSESIGVPEPYYMAEKPADSYSSNYDKAYCTCGEEYSITVSAGYSDGYIEIEGLDEEDDVKIVIEYEELDEYYEEQINSILANKDYYALFINEIKNLKRLNKINLEDEDLQKTLQRQLFSAAITCLEDYLSSTLIIKIMTDDDNFKNLVRTFHNIRNRNFSLNEIYEKLEKLKDIVKRELLDIIYHDLPKVKGMYEDSLRIKFPDIGDLMKDIMVRHDMVHRNGKNKGGAIIEMSGQRVDTIIQRVEIFVEEIESELNHSILKSI